MSSNILFIIALNLLVFWAFGTFSSFDNADYIIPSILGVIIILLGAIQGYKKYNKGNY